MQAWLPLTVVPATHRAEGNLSFAAFMIVVARQSFGDVSDFRGGER